MKNSLCLHIITMLCLTINILAMDSMEIDSEHQYPLLLRHIKENKDNTVETLEHDSSIILKTHDWAQQHQPDLLKNSYQNLLKRYKARLKNDRSELLMGQRDALYGSFCQTLDHYADIDLRDVKNTLYKQAFDNVMHMSFERSAPLFPLQLLQMLKKRAPNSFNKRIKDHMIPRFYMHCVLAHRQEAAALDDEKFNLETLVKEALADEDYKTTNFETILYYENKEHSEFLEQEIITILPSIFKKHYLSSPTFESLSQSPSLKIRNSTLSTLFSTITNHEATEHVKREIIKKIFQYKTSLPLQEEELYQTLFGQLQNAPDNIRHFGMQLLIKQLAQQPMTPFFRNVLSSYLNIPIQESQFNTVNEAITHALDQETLPLSQVSNILFNAHITGFGSFLNDDMTHHLKIKTLLNEEVPTKTRSRLLDELLMTHYVTKKESSPILIKEIEQLPDSPFKQYAQNLLIALDRSKHQTSYFAARAELLKLKNKYPDDFPFSYEPEILKNLRKPLFQAFNEWQKMADHHIHIEIEDELKNLQFPQGPYCFGYVSTYKGFNDNTNTYQYSYQLHACNKKTGIPIWASPMIWNKKNAYAVGERYVYCVTDDNNIAMLDLETGDPISEINLGSQKRTIRMLHVCGPDEIYAVQDKAILLVNTQKRDCQTIPLPNELFPGYAFTIENSRLIIPTNKDIFILDHDNQWHHALHYCDDDLFINPRTCKGTAEFIVYQKRENPNRSLALLKTDTYEQLWEYPLNSEIEQIQISPSDGTIFVLTKYTVLALHPHAEDEHRLLWQTELNYNEGTEIDSIHLTHDGSALYGIKKGSGALFSFNIQNGQKDFLYEKHVGRDSIIIGDYDHKLYIQGINF